MFYSKIFFIKLYTLIFFFNKITQFLDLLNDLNSYYCLNITVALKIFSSNSIEICTKLF